MFVSSALIGQAVHQLLLIQAFRPDRLLAMSHIFVSKVMEKKLHGIIEQPLDLANIVDSGGRDACLWCADAVMLRMLN